MINKQNNYLDCEFQETIFYLRKLKQSIRDTNQEISKEDKLLLVIEHAVIHDRFNEGSILITKNESLYQNRVGRNKKTIYKKANTGIYRI